MRKLLIIIFVMLSAQVSSDIIMVCEADDYRKHSYKLIQSDSGKNTVEYKVKGQWVNWINELSRDLIVVKSEIYESGAMLVAGTHEISNEDYPEEELFAGKKYYIEGTIILDFELASRKLTLKVYEDELSARELKKHLMQQEYNNTCEYTKEVLIY